MNRATTGRYRLSDIGFRKNGPSLSIQWTLSRETRGRFHPVRRIGTHADISVPPACSSSLPQRRRRLFRSLFQVCRLVCWQASSMQTRLNIRLGWAYRVFILAFGISSACLFFILRYRSAPSV